MTVRAQSNNLSRHIDIVFCDVVDEIITHIAKPVKFEFVKIEENKPIESPTLRLVSWEAQSLVDELYRIGIRAKQEPILKNELASTKYHLEDMRKIVMKKEGITLKEE